MVWNVVEAWRNVTNPSRYDVPQEPALDVALRQVEEEIGRCCPGANALTVAIERLSRVSVTADAWRTLGASIKPRWNRDTLGPMLVRAHVSTSAVGLKHVIGQMPINALGRDTLRVIDSLTPEATAEIVERWRLHRCRHTGYGISLPSDV